MEDVIEQADYLYGSGETEKLYRLLVQHKNRYLIALRHYCDFFSVLFCISFSTNVLIVVCWRTLLSSLSKEERRTLGLFPPDGKMNEGLVAVEDEV